jgi:SPP1 family predicted phage head-tail adaptor
MQSGEMRTRVTLQARSLSTDAGGFQTPVWVDIADVWAKWVGVHGSEAWAASSVQAQGAATVTIRYRDDVDSTCAVLVGDQLYEIVSIDDIRQKHELLELKVQQMRSG